MGRLLTGLAALLLFGAMPAKAEWRRAESPNFILYGDLSETALRARILQLEDFDRLLRMLTPVEEAPAASKLPVYILGGHRDLEMLGDLPPGAAGFYMASPNGIAAFVDNSAESGNVILLHEYAHHFMRQTGAAYPAWFVEGFAEYFSTVRFSERAIDIGMLHEGRSSLVMDGVWLPLERILSAGPRDLNREQGAAYYAQSWLLTHYFYSNAQRQAALGRLLAALRRQEPAAEALRGATGFTFEALAPELRRYIAGGRITYRRMTRASAAASPPVTITALPASADAMLLFEASLRIGIPQGRESDYLRRIREAAARFPDDPLAMRVLAHAELRHGDGAAADRLLDRLLATAPGDAELLYLKGLRWLVAAEGSTPPENAAATARQWFTRAFAADPNHFQTLFRFAQTLRNEPEFYSDNTRNVLLRARRLAPQVSTITMNAATLLAQRGEYADAILLLRPIAESPHDGEAARQARAMIAEAGRRLDARPAAGNEAVPPAAPAAPAGD